MYTTKKSQSKASQLSCIILFLDVSAPMTRRKLGQYFNIYIYIYIKRVRLLQRTWTVYISPVEENKVSNRTIYVCRMDNHHDFDSHLAENDLTLSYFYDLFGRRLF